MQKLFNKILVPVNFPGFSSKAAGKAVLMAREFNCSITLLYAAGTEQLRYNNAAAEINNKPAIEITGYSEIESQLKKLVNKSEILAGCKLEIDAVIEKGGWNECITEYISRHKIDLVILCQKKYFLGQWKMAADPGRIAAVTNVPVITIPSNRRITGLASIGIPVTDYLPVRKIMYGIYLANANNATLKLLGVKIDEGDEKNEYYLYKAYKLIRDNCVVPTELETIRGESAAAAVDDYVHNSSADLVIVNPDPPGSIPGLFSSLFNHLLQRHGGSPVMTVSPL